LENFFPMAGKTGPVFPVNGKNFREFSSEWKKCFQWLENFRRRLGAVPPCPMRIPAKVAKTFSGVREVFGLAVAGKAGYRAHGLEK
jgi:hypothetical protein